MKGQWNSGLFAAAKEQLTARYTIYPGAADQGVYLILWFGRDVTVAGKKSPSLSSPALLRREILRTMPAELTGRIDVYVLDVSRSRKTKSKAPKAKSGQTPAIQVAKAKAKPAAKPRKKAPATTKGDVTTKSVRAIVKTKKIVPKLKAKRGTKVSSKTANKKDSKSKTARTIGKAKTSSSKSKTGKSKKASANASKKPVATLKTRRGGAKSKNTSGRASKSSKRNEKKSAQ